MYENPALLKKKTDSLLQADSLVPSKLLENKTGELAVQTP
jgi:hypothetical protein